MICWSLSFSTLIPLLFFLAGGSENQIGKSIFYPDHRQELQAVGYDQMLAWELVNNGQSLVVRSVFSSSSIRLVDPWIPIVDLPTMTVSQAPFTKPPSHRSSDILLTSFGAIPRPGGGLSRTSL